MTRFVLVPAFGAFRLGRRWLRLVGIKYGTTSNERVRDEFGAVQTDSYTRGENFIGVKRRVTRRRPRMILDESVAGKNEEESGL